MKTILVATLLVLLIPCAYGAAPDVQAGKAAWDARLCRNCHGNNGEGAYGPDLAGRAISPEQFLHAVRKPWGVMPAFTERQVSNQQVADIAAYLTGLPKVAEPAAWRFPPPPADAPRGQMLLVTNGCAQCHQPELLNPRMVLGGESSEAADFNFFSKLVYNHTDEFPDGRMGNFNRIRLPEVILQDIYKFAVKDLGLLPNLTAEIAPGTPSGGNTTYTFTLKNAGMKAKGGLTAEDLAISLNLAPGVSAVSGTGAGYKVQKDPKTNADIVMFQASRIAPEEAQTYTVTVSGKVGTAAEVFRGSAVRWTKPEVRKIATLALKDARVPAKYTEVPVTFPAPQQR